MGKSLLIAAFMSRVKIGIPFKMTRFGVTGLEEVIGAHIIHCTTVLAPLILFAVAACSQVADDSASKRRDALLDKAAKALLHDHYDQATRYETEAIRLDLSNAELYESRGTTYYLMHEYDEAIADFSEAIRLNPNDETAYNRRCEAYGEKGQHEQEIAACTQAVGAFPDDLLLITTAA